MNKFKHPQLIRKKGNIITDTPVLFSDILAFIWFLDKTNCYYTDMRFYPTPYDSKEYKIWFDCAWENLKLNVVGEDVFDIVTILRECYLRGFEVSEEILKREIVSDFENNIIFDDCEYNIISKKMAEIFYDFRKYKLPDIVIKEIENDKT